MILALVLCGWCARLWRLWSARLCTKAAEPETVIETEPAAHKLLLELLLIPLLVVELELIVVLLHLILVLLLLLLLRIRVRGTLLGRLLWWLRGWLLHEAARQRLQH